MKVFEYVCDKCSRRFEAFVSGDDHTVTCCGEPARKVISSPQFSLPGHSADWPTAHAKWVKEHENAGRS